MTDPVRGTNPDPLTHKALARWAAACAERTLPIFENARPGDVRPRTAIDTLHAWIKDDVPMTACRSAAFAAHAAARDAEQAGAPAAVAAARATGQAAAVAHTANHARHVATYAAKAVGLQTSDEQSMQVERDWQWGSLSPRVRPHAFPASRDERLDSG
ncbi:putative immunity protein [Mycolicibacterium chlorophenolicum]|uniref:putative immunity protein n=1 Tax=Mycolicibacterium chlorophenolicum TaxID=37916 RepID=UPI000AD6DBF3